MRAWMIYAKADAIKNERYINFFKEEGKLRGIAFEVVLIEDLIFGIRNHSWYIKYQGADVKVPDFVVCRTIYPLLSSQLESMGIPVFNNAMVARICNDKALTYQFVTQLGIPMVETSFCRAMELERKLEETDYCSPVVFKAVAGHGGSQVFLYDKNSSERISQAKAIREGLAGSDFVIQPLTGSRNQDLRVYVIGKEIIACVLRTAKEGFKSNFSLGGSVELYSLTEKESALVHQVMQLFDFGLVGIDFIIDDDGQLIFNEIEDVVGARMLYQCSDINLVGRYLDYITSHLDHLSVDRVKE